MQFFERLELFAFESVRRQEELTERIRKEVGLRQYWPEQGSVWFPCMPNDCLIPRSMLPSPGQMPFLEAKLPHPYILSFSMHR